MACNSTRVIPFRCQFQPGVSLYEQVVYAAKKAIVSGQMLPGDPFPSVRALSRELKINPNTAHKVVTQLTSEGVLAVHPGIGTVVAALTTSPAVDRRKLLDHDLEQFLVEARQLGLSREDIVTAIDRHWTRLHPKVKR